MNILLVNDDGINASGLWALSGALMRSHMVTVGEGRDFERIRRITGYLVGTTDRWNNAKRAEERDRVKHSLASRG